MDPHTIEINLLGSGGGYGESIVAHVGNNEWIVIDSCKNPTTGKSIPLQLLKEKDVELENVKLVVCTHWHDDHIQGISELFENTPKSELSYARAHDQEKFLRYVSLDYQKAEYSPSNSSTEEFIKCLKLNIERNNGVIKVAGPDRLLFSSSIDGKTISIHSLSPSDLSCKIFDEEISRLIDIQGKRNKRTPYESPNHRSVVILIQCGTHNILLGSDLEISENPRLGWTNILENSTVVKQSGESSYFKIPHHGSENGYKPEVWSDLLNTNPTSGITPWNKGTKLPKPNMIDKYRSHTNCLYMTSPTYDRSKPKTRDHRIEKIIGSFNSTLEEIRFDYGLITSRIDLSDDQAEWTTEVKGSAFDCHN